MARSALGVQAAANAADRRRASWLAGIRSGDLSWHARVPAGMKRSAYLALLRATLPFSHAGLATVRVRGRIEPGGETIVVERQVTVQ
jgi:hypothetical protein